MKNVRVKLKTLNYQILTKKSYYMYLGSTSLSKRHQNVSKSIKNVQSHMLPQGVMMLMNRFQLNPHLYSISGTRKSAMKHIYDNPVVLKQNAESLTNTHDSTTAPAIAMTSFEGFNVTIRQIPFPGGFRAEDVLESWCTYEKCAISPRTYYHVRYRIQILYTYIRRKIRLVDFLSSSFIFSLYNIVDGCLILK